MKGSLVSTTAQAPTPIQRSAAAAIAAQAEKAEAAAPAPDGLTVEEVEDVEVDLSGAPALRPPKTMRIRQRTALWKRVLSMSDRLKSMGGEDGELVLTAENTEALDVLAEIDELLEEYAVDPGAYAVWATEDGGGPDVEARVTALFGRYAEQLGESAPSTT